MRLRALANAVRALVALNRRVARLRSPEEYRQGEELDLKYLRTDSGSLRQRLPLELGPLGNFSDQVWSPVYHWELDWNPDTALEATHGQNDSFFSQLSYKCYLEEVASVGY